MVKNHFLKVVDEKLGKKPTLEKEVIMNFSKAESMFETAKDYVEKNDPTLLEWAKSINEHTFDNLSSRDFLTVYCWVVYVSGFSVKIVEKNFQKSRKFLKILIFSPFQRWILLSQCSQYLIMREKPSIF